jgi:hypothetical protein
VVNLSLPGVSLRHINPLGLDVDAQAPRPATLRRCNDNATVSTTKVINLVVAGYFGQVEHPVNNIRRCGDIGRKYVPWLVGHLEGAEVSRGCAADQNQTNCQPQMNTDDADQKSV